MNSEYSNSPYFYKLLVILIFICYTTYGIPITFYPHICEEKKVDSILVGLIFAMYPLGAFISGILMGKIMYKLKKKYVIIASQLIMALAFICFGLSDAIKEKNLFIGIGLITRLIQGLALGTFQTAVYSYVPEFWPESMEQKIGVLEISVGFGVGFGPIIGSIIYYLSNYFLLYLIPSGIIIFFALILSSTILPNLSSHISVRQNPISTIKAYSNKDILFGTAVLVINYGALTFMMPDFEDQIIDLGGSPTLSSLIFSLSQIGDILGTFFVIFYKTEFRKTLFFFSLILELIALILIGYPNFISISVGMFILGISNAFAVVPNITENLSILKTMFQDIEEEFINDMASSIFIVSISLSEFIGPLLGGLFFDILGFESSIFIYINIVMIYLIIYSWKGNGLFNVLLWFNDQIK